METKKIVMGVISVAVAIVVLMSMIPIFTDAGASEDTFTNTGFYRMAEYDDTASFTAKWDHTAPTKFTVDGVTYDLPTTQQSIDLNLMCAESFFLRYNVLSSYVYVQTYGDSFAGSYTAKTTDSTDMTITVSAGSITFSNGVNPAKTTTFTKLYAVATDGEYVLKKPTESAYVLGDSTIVAIGHSSYNIDTYLIGSIDDGFTREYRNTSNPSAEVTNFTFSDVTVDDSEVSGYIDLYSLVKLTWTATNTDTSVTYDTIYSQFLVPYEVTAERSAHASPVEATLIGLIPLLMMVGIMLTAVGLFIAKYRKN